MPCYNSACYIKRAIDSVINQTYQNFELIVIDDLSKDESVNIVKTFDDSRIKLVELSENCGAAVSRNVGIEMAVGRFIAFLDSDDLWRPNKLETQIQFMIDKPCAFSFSHYQRFSRLGKGKVMKAPEVVTYEELLRCNVIGCLTAVYDTHIIGKQYMPLIRKRQDFGLWLKILSHCGKAYGCPVILADYRTDSGMTQNKLNAAKHQWMFYRKELGFSLLKTSKYFISYAINGVLRR